jgi:hypothetical protein
MSKIARILPRGARYGAFLSVSDLLGIDRPGLRGVPKVQFLPQFETTDNSSVEAVLSKRFLLVDAGISDVSTTDLTGIERVAERLARASREAPEELLKIALAFGQSGTREDREELPERARRLGLMNPDDSEPTAIWVGILLVGAALLISSCCNETDTDCGSNGSDTDVDTDGGQNP